MGRVDAADDRSVSIPPLSREVVSLDAIAPDEAGPVVHVTATGGVVSAVLDDAVDPRRDGAVASTTRPAPPRPAPTSSCPASRRGGPTSAAARQPRRHRGPGPGAAAHRQGGGAAGRPPGRPRAAGSTLDVPMPGQRGGPGSRHPLRPAPRRGGLDRAPCDHRGPDGRLRLDGGGCPPCVAWPECSCPASSGTTKRLLLTAGPAPASAQVRLGTGDGAKVSTVAVPADSTVAVAVGDADAVWVVPSSGAVRAAVSVAGVDGGVPFFSVAPLSDAPVRALSVAGASGAQLTVRRGRGAGGSLPEAGVELLGGDPEQARDLLGDDVGDECSDVAAVRDPGLDGAPVDDDPRRAGARRREEPAERRPRGGPTEPGRGARPRRRTRLREGAPAASPRAERRHRGRSRRTRHGAAHGRDRRPGQRPAATAAVPVASPATPGSAGRGGVHDSTLDRPSPRLSVAAPGGIRPRVISRSDGVVIRRSAVRAARVPDRGSDTWMLEDGMRRPAVATLTYAYGDRAVVLGPLATYAEPHTYDLCLDHAERLTAPRGWEIVRVGGEYSEPALAADDLLALADAVREAGRPRRSDAARQARRRALGTRPRRPGGRRGRVRRRRVRPPRTPAHPARLLSTGTRVFGVPHLADFVKAYDVRGLVPEQLDARRGPGHRRRVRRGRRGPGRRAPASSSATTCGPRSPELRRGLRRRRRPSRGVDVVLIGLCSHRRALLRQRRPRRCPARCSPRATTPRSYNGIKLCRSAARPVGQDTGLAEIRDLAQWLPRRRHAACRAGRRPGIGARRATSSPTTPRFLRGLVDLSGIRPLKVVVDAGNGMGGHTVPAVLGTGAGLPELPLDDRPALLRARRHLPQPRGQPARPGQPRRPAGGRPRARRRPRARLRRRRRPLLRRRRRRRAGVARAPSPGSSPSARSPGLARAATRRSSIVHNVISQRRGAPRSSPRPAPRRCAPGSGTRSSRPRWPAPAPSSAASTPRTTTSATSGSPTPGCSRPCTSSPPSASRTPRSPTSRASTSATSRPARSTRRSTDPTAVVEHRAGLGAAARGRHRRARRPHRRHPEGSTPMWWFNVRASNTEPLLRLNVEAADRETMAERARRACSP